MSKELSKVRLQQELMKLYANIEDGVERRQDLFAPSKLFASKEQQSVTHDPNGIDRRRATPSEIQEALNRKNE